MYEIKISKEFESATEVLDYLNTISMMVKDGHTYGDGWRLTGDDLIDEDDA